MVGNFGVGQILEKSSRQIWAKNSAHIVVKIVGNFLATLRENWGHFWAKKKVGNFWGKKWANFGQKWWEFLAKNHGQFGQKKISGNFWAKNSGQFLGQKYWIIFRETKLGNFRVKNSG